MLTIMCGYPASGKSSWIKNHIENEIIVSLDEIRKEIFGTQFFQNSEPFVIAIGETMVRMLLKQGKDVILDSTALTIGVRSKYIKIAKDYNSDYCVIFIDTDIKICKERDKNRENKVGEDVFNKFEIQFQSPVIDSYIEPNKLIIVEDAKNYIL